MNDLAYSGTLSEIWLAPRRRVPLTAVPRVRAVPGRGLEGDRYFLGKGSMSRWPRPERAVSLIASEALDAAQREHGIDLCGGRSRRNLVVAGLDLTRLIGRTFRIGSAVLRGVSPCKPCQYLERLTAPGAFAALAGRGGIRAVVLVEGDLAAGDTVFMESSP